MVGGSMVGGSMAESEALFTAMHILQGICAVIILGLAVWLAYTIIRSNVADIGHHEVDDAHRD